MLTAGVKRQSYALVALLAAVCLVMGCRDSAPNNPRARETSTPRPYDGPLAPIVPSSVTTISGTEEKGFKDGPAAEAQFGGASAIAVDEAGNVYVADAKNNRIRLISAGGVVSTLAGSGETVLDKRDPRGGYRDGPGSQAQFDHPAAITYAGGELYIADRGNHRIRKVSLDGVVSTLAGSGVRGLKDGVATEAQFSDPEGVAVDGTGVVYVADSGNNRVRRIGLDGAVTTIAGPMAGGLQFNADLARPKSIVVDAAGTIYVGDWFHGRVRKIAPNGEPSTLITSAAADGSATGFATPSDLALDGRGNLVIADPGTQIIHSVAPDGTLRRLAGTGDMGVEDGPGESAKFVQPFSVAINAAGEIFVFDRGLVRKITLTP